MNDVADPGSPAPTETLPVSAMLAFGLLCGGLGLLSAALAIEDPLVTFWRIAGPFLGLTALVQAAGIIGNEPESRSGPALGDLTSFAVVIGATVGAVGLGFSPLDRWVMPAVFFLLAIGLGYRAGIHRQPVPTTATLVMAVLAAATGASTIEGGAALTLVALGAVLVSGSLALHVAASDDRVVALSSRR